MLHFQDVAQGKKMLVPLISLVYPFLKYTNRMVSAILRGTFVAPPASDENINFINIKFAWI